MKRKPPIAAAPATCPCGNALPYAGCCGRWHVGAQQWQAPDAAALMRSRYSAYVLGLADYLLHTWHPRTRPAELPLQAGMQWLGLEQRRHTVQDAERSTVEFVARSRFGGRAVRLHETSRFERVDGCWYYVDGDLA